MAVFCTYFDRNYLTRGVSLFRSLQRYVPNVELWALCLDDETFDAVNRLHWPGLRPVALAELERADPALLGTKPTRTLIEYYFTCTAAWTHYVVHRVPPGALVAYVDADIMFYSDPSPLFTEMDNGSAAIIPHGFPERLKYFECCGLYNVGCVVFRNDDAGRAVLSDWRAQCIEWCYHREEEGRFADQGYLDTWPARFPAVRVIRNPGVGLGPWNWMTRAIDSLSDPPMVNGTPLIFYHFHGFHPIGRWLYDCGLGELYGPMPDAIRQRLYGDYALDLRESNRVIQTTAPGAPREVPHLHEGVYRFYLTVFRNLLRRNGTIYLTPWRRASAGR